MALTNNKVHSIRQANKPIQYASSIYVLAIVLGSPIKWLNSVA